LTPPADDPGWRPNWKIFVPGLAPVAMREAGARGLLAGLRSVFVSFCVALVLFGVVLLFLPPSDADDPLSDELAMGIVAAVGVVSLAVGLVVGRLDGSSVEALKRSYNQRFFLRIATSELPGLVGFVLAFIAESHLPYFFSLLFVAVGFARAAPTTASIQRDQDQLNAAGSAADLRQALG
jgi:hypothetical protein